MPTSVPLTKDIFHGFTTLPSPIATSTPISTPITIAPCPNVFVSVSQPQVSIPQTIPLFNESTTITTTTISTPPVIVNESNMGAGASGVTIGPCSTTISHLHDDYPATIFGDDWDDFQYFHFSPFNVKQSSDDKYAPMTKRQLKPLNEKLDTLIESSKASLSSEYSHNSYKSLFETLTKEHVVNLAASTKFIENSEKTVCETTKKVDKLLF